MSCHWFCVFFLDSRAAVSLLKGADINVVTGLLKMYLRELPEALFTDDKYAEIVKGMSRCLADCC